MNKTIKETFNIILVIIAAILMAVNINTFVYTAGLLPGGFTGIVLLIQDIFQKYLNVKIPYSLFLWILNLWPAIICFKNIGKRFTLLSLLMIIVSGLATDFIPGLFVTDDILLCTIFGGIINGISICLCLFVGATSGGTDFISIYLSEKKGISAWNYIFAGNCILLAIFGLLFGWTKALYSIIFQFATTQVINSLYKRYQKSTLFIISDHWQEIVKTVKKSTNHNATIFSGKGSYNGADRTMIYTIVGKDQEAQLVHEIMKIDPKAFVNVLETKALLGNFNMQKL